MKIKKQLSKKIHQKIPKFGRKLYVANHMISYNIEKTIACKL